MPPCTHSWSPGWVAPAMSAEGLVVDAQQALHPCVESGVLGEIVPAGGDSTRMILAGAVKLSDDRIRHRGRVQRRQPYGGKVGTEIAMARNVGRHHRRAAADAFQRSKSKALVRAGSHEDVGSVKERTRVGAERRSANRPLYVEATNDFVRMLAGAHHERQYPWLASCQFPDQFHPQGPALAFPVPYECGKQLRLGGNSQLRPSPRALPFAANGKAVEIDSVREQQRAPWWGAARHQLGITGGSHTEVCIDQPANQPKAEYLAQDRRPPLAQRSVPMPDNDHRLGSARSTRGEGGGDIPAREVSVQDRWSPALGQQRGNAAHPGATRRQGTDPDVHAGGLCGRIPGAIPSRRRKHGLKRPPACHRRAADRLERRQERGGIWRREVTQVNDANLAGSSRRHRGGVYWRDQER